MASFNKTIRSLHRDLGYFVIGLTLLYAITGIILSGRALGWLEQEFHDKAVISKNISPKDFKKEFVKTVAEGKLLNIFDKDSSSMLEKRLRLKLESKVDDIYTYKAWRSLELKYKKTSGNLEVSYKGLPPYIKIFNEAHKATHESAWFYLAIIYSVILSFLAISSFWMLKGKNGFRRRGVYFMLAGFAVVALFLFLG